MIIYIFVLFILSYFIIRYDVMQKTSGYTFSYLFILLNFILIAGLRYKIGSDTLVYMEEYIEYPSLFDLARYDILWVLFCAICKTISKSFFFMQFVQALIINCIYFYFIYKNTNYRFTALFLYFIFGFLYFNTEIMRESLAVAIFLLSLHSFYKKKWIRYFLLVIIASLFHSSALITLFFPLVHRIKISNFFFYSILILTLLSNVLWKLFNESIHYFFILSSSIESKASAYLDNDAFIYNFNGILLGIIIYVLLPLIFVFLAKKYEQTNIKESPFLWLYILFGIFVVFNNTIFMRFQNYLFFPFIIFLSNFFFESKKSLKYIFLRKTKIAILLLSLFIGRHYNYFKPDITETTYIYNRYFPYHSIITKKTTTERELLDYYW